MGVYPYNTITRATSGPQTDPARAAAIFAVLGTSSAEPNAGPGPLMFTTDAEPEAEFGYGPMPETAAIISSYSGQATIGMRLEEADPGGYETIDLTAFDGTAVPATDATIEPYNDHEVYILFPSGGTLGTAGIRYSVSLDGGRSFIAQRQPLGTATSITVARANARLLLGGPAAQVTALITLVAQARVQTLAHLAEGSTVHLTADVTSGAAISGIPATEAAAYDVVNDLVTALVAHATNNTVHTADDISSFVDPPPVAVDFPTAVARAIWVKDGINAHLALTGSVHGSAPATADVTAPDPVNGTVVAGDVIQVQTNAPTWDAASLAGAMSAADVIPAAPLTAYSKAYGGIVIRGRFPVDAWATLINGLDALRARQRSVIAIIEARLPTSGETPAEYLDSLEEEWEGLYDERVYVVSGDGRYDPAKLSATRYQSRRLQTAPLVARLAALDYAESPGVVATSARKQGIPSVFGGPLDGYRIRDNNGALVGIDAFLDAGAQATAGFGCVASVPNTDDRLCWVHNPLMRAPVGSTAPHIAHQRIASVIETILYIEGTKLVQQHPARENGTTHIRGDAADHFDAAIYGKVIAVVGDPTQGIAPRVSRFVFHVDRNADISEDPVVLPWTAEADFGSYIASLAGVFSLNGGA